MDTVVNVIPVKEGLPYGAATVSLHSKTVYIDEEKMKRFTTSEQNAIIFHEHGHLLNNSADEFEADKVGFELLVKSKDPNLDAHYTWMEKTLEDGPNPELEERLKAAKDRVQHYFMTSEQIVNSVGSAGYSEVMNQPIETDANLVGLGAAIASSAGAVVGGIDNIINGNKRSKDARKAVEAQAAAQNNLAQAQIRAAELASRAQEKLAAIASANTQTIIIGLIVVAAIVGMVLLLRKKKKAAVAGPSPAPAPPIVPQPQLPLPAPTA